jgi:hypothetical protein
MSSLPRDLPTCQPTKHAPYVSHYAAPGYTLTEVSPPTATSVDSPPIGAPPHQLPHLLHPSLPSTVTRIPVPAPVPPHQISPPAHSSNSTHLSNIIMVRITTGRCEISTPRFTCLCVTGEFEVAEGPGADLRCAFCDHRWRDHCRDDMDLRVMSPSGPATASPISSQNAGPQHASRKRPHREDSLGVPCSRLLSVLVLV